ncbi:MAG: tetratricopeptide repeat protein [Bdellovibrionaceae bacterium]|nr:tetratricopeptide repeat protein [Pseudobdellovibrionaceae bacterium]
MSAETNCPKCDALLVDTGHNSLPVLCTACGFIPEATSSHIERRLERSNLHLVVVFSVVLVVGFMHLASWGNHALEIRWIQFGDIAGLSSVDSLERMAKICIELKKRDCVEYAYLRQSQLDKRNAVRLAEFQMSRRKFNEAVKTLKPYVATEAGKKDTRAYMTYANALTEVGRYDEATNYYEYLISKSQGLPTEATRNYVKCLARAKRFEQAQKVILKVRKSYPGTSRFMDGEYRVLAGLKSGPVKPDSTIR